MELQSASHLTDLTIHATDGEIGSMEEFYFDDEKWTIRYLVVDTGSWLSERQVLISPIFVAGTDRATKQLHLALTKDQIANSPGIDTHKPVSRQHEAEYMDYYGLPYYWGGSYMWDSGPLPVDVLPAMPPKGSSTPVPQESADSHLRSTNAVTGYHIVATDGEVGHVKDFIVDQKDWSIRYLEVDTRNWWPGKKVLIAPSWVEKISWLDSEVVVGLPRETIKSSPEYLESQPITRGYEGRLYKHYGRTPYWT